MTLTHSYQRRRRTTRGLRNRPGFSILEMLVVVILVGIIMSVAGVRVSDMMVQQRVIRAASTIQTELESAFAIAGRNREPTRIAFTSATGSILLRVTNRTGTTSFKQIDFKQLGLNHGDVTSSVSEVIVFPNGFANSTLTMTVSVTRNGQLFKRVVQMTRAGMIKVT